MTTTNPPLSDYSTQQARSDELRRRKLRRELLARVSALTAALTSESIEMIAGITDDEWKAAQDAT